MRINEVYRKAIEIVRERKRSLIQGLVITLLAALASATLGASGLGRILSSMTIDVLTRRSATHKESRVVLINITEDDYNSVFARKRPLNPLIILKLVQAALTGGAKLVAIDIATEDWPRQPDIDRALTSLGAPDSPRSVRKGAVVWARNFYLQEGRVRPQYAMEPFLGGSTLAARECYGVPALGEEAGIVRWFYSGFEINGVYEPSFAQQILHRAANQSCLDHAESQDLRLIAYSSEIKSESPRTLLLEGADKDWGTRARPYDGKIVILGGSFHVGGDIRQTPVGSRSGLQITGQAVASALSGEARAEIEERWSLLIDIALGVLVILLGLISHRMQLWATAGAFVLAVAGMWLLWREYYLFLSFVPIFIGLVAHLVLEKLFPAHAHPANAAAPGETTAPEAKHA